jgi:hypothetical protein
MPDESCQSEKWEPQRLYCFLLGHLDRYDERIPENIFDDSLNELIKALVDELEGCTEVQLMDAFGHTQQWAPQATTLVLALVMPSHEQSADDWVVAREKKLLTAFKQKEIWITKQEVNLFKAGNSGKKSEQ